MTGPGLGEKIIAHTHTHKDRHFIRDKTKLMKKIEKESGPVVAKINTEIIHFFIAWPESCRGP